MDPMISNMPRSTADLRSKICHGIIGAFERHIAENMFGYFWYTVRYTLYTVYTMIYVFVYVCVKSDTPKWPV